jgi:hypothetical protein
MLFAEAGVQRFPPWGVSSWLQQRVEQNPNLSGQAIMEKLGLTQQQYVAVKTLL